MSERNDRTIRTDDQLPPAVQEDVSADELDVESLEDVSGGSGLSGDGGIGSNNFNCGCSGGS